MRFLAIGFFFLTLSLIGYLRGKDITWAEQVGIVTGLFIGAFISIELELI